MLINLPFASHSPKQLSPEACTYPMGVGSCRALASVCALSLFLLVHDFVGVHGHIFTRDWCTGKEAPLTSTLSSGASHREEV
jgi:hypothetical protein